MAVNLELMNALFIHHKIVVPCNNKESIEEAQKQTVDYWMRHKRGTGWVILTIDINTFGMLWWEETPTLRQSKQLGPVKPSTRLLEGFMSPSALVMVEHDKWTPPFIMEHADRIGIHQDSRIVIYEHQGDW